MHQVLIASALCLSGSLFVVPAYRSFCVGEAKIQIGASDFRRYQIRGWAYVISAALLIAQFIVCSALNASH